MRRLLLASLIALAPAAAMATDYSQTLTAGTITPVLTTPVPGQWRVFQKITNVGTAGVAWCSRYSATPAANQPNSFPIAPFGDASGRPAFELFTQPSYIPQLPLWCTADTGTARITVETAP